MNHGALLLCRPRRLRLVDFQLQPLLELRQLNRCLSWSTAELGPVGFPGRVALELHLIPALPTAHAHEPMLATERQLQRADGLRFSSAIVSPRFDRFDLAFTGRVSGQRRTTL